MFLSELPCDIASTFILDAPKAAKKRPATPVVDRNASPTMANIVQGETAVTAATFPLANSNENPSRIASIAIFS